MAVPDIKVERRVNLGIVEFHQHIIAGNAELGSAEGDEGGDVKAAHSYQIKSRSARGKAEFARVRVVKGGLRRDAETTQQRHHLVEDPTVGQRKDQYILDMARIRCASHTRSSASCRGCHRVGQGSPRSCA